MPKRIPISAAKRIATDHDLRQVILFAWDGKAAHVVTYGKSIEDAAVAADLGDKIKSGVPAHGKEVRMTKEIAVAKQNVMTTLEKAEKHLRETGTCFPTFHAERKAIVDEMDRLRGECALLRKTLKQAVNVIASGYHFDGQGAWLKGANAILGGK